MSNSKDMSPREFKRKIWESLSKEVKLNGGVPLIVISTKDEDTHVHFSPGAPRELIISCLGSALEGLMDEEEKRPGMN